MCNPDAMTISPEEIALLCFDDECADGAGEFAEVVTFIREGDFHQLFNHRWFELYKHSTIDTLNDILQNALNNGRREEKLKLLTSGVAFLSYFIQQNFLGPVDKEAATDVLFVTPKQIDYLNVDGEDAYHLVKAPVALYIAKLLFSQFDELLLDSYSTTKIWKLRYALVHQQVIVEKVQSLQTIVEQTTMDDRAGYLSEKLHQLWLQLKLENAIAHLAYFNITQTEKILTEVADSLGISVELSGALGTRTHFQQSSVAQLTLKVGRTKEQSTLPATIAANEVPLDVRLQDDVVMNEIKFDQEQESGRLSYIEQTLVLTLSMLRKRLNAPEELLDEEVMAYLNRLLADPQLWTIQFSSLFQRSVMECVKSRKVERTLSQLQALLEHVHKQSPGYGTRSRLFFAARMPSTWKVERHLANGFISLGLTKSALDIYLRLELWEEVVECYQRLQRNDRAEAIVRELLEDEKTPQLYCLLGDVTGDPENYRIAWELSNEKNARSKRSLGFYHFQRKEYEEAIPHLRQSLELNRLHHRAWQQLAFACMSTERFDESVAAYKRVVNIDSDNFEAWNNMAKAYIALNEKEKAWRVLQESLKCNYEDWRIWENYILVSMDVGAFNEVVKSWHRLIEIKGKHSDGNIASLLVRVVKDNLRDIEGNEAAGYLQPKLFELFGRATTGVTNDVDTWKAYGDLYASTTPVEQNRWSEHVYKTIQCYQKGIRSQTQKPQWERDSTAARKAIELCNTAWSTLNSMSKQISADESLRIKASLDMSIKNVLVLVKRSVDYHNHDDANKLLSQLERLEEEIK